MSSTTIPVTVAPDAFAFLETLAAHNDRDWFNANKSVRHRARKAVRPPARDAEQPPDRCPAPVFGRQGDRVPHEPRRALQRGQAPLQDQSLRSPDRVGHEEGGGRYRLSPARRAGRLCGGGLLRPDACRAGTDPGRHDRRRKGLRGGQGRAGTGRTRSRPRRQSDGDAERLCRTCRSSACGRAETEVPDPARGPRPGSLAFRWSSHRVEPLARDAMPLLAFAEAGR